MKDRFDPKNLWSSELAHRFSLLRILISPLSKTLLSLLVSFWKNVLSSCVLHFVLAVSNRLSNTITGCHFFSRFLNKEIWITCNYSIKLCSVFPNDDERSCRDNNCLRELSLLMNSWWYVSTNGSYSSIPDCRWALTVKALNKKLFTTNSWNHLRRGGAHCVKDQHQGIQRQFLLWEVHL